MGTMGKETSAIMMRRLIAVCRELNPGNGSEVFRNRGAKRPPFHRRKDFRATFGF